MKFIFLSLVLINTNASAKFLDRQPSSSLLPSPQAIVRILPDLVCTENELAAGSLDNAVDLDPIPADLFASVRRATGMIVYSAEDYSRGNALGATFHGHGSAFAIRGHYGTDWYTAAHLIPTPAAGTPFGYIFPTTESTENDRDITGFSARVSFSVSAHQRDLHRPFQRESLTGSDFTRIDSRDLTYADLEVKNQIPALPTRDLLREPLTAAEHLYIAGYPGVSLRLVVLSCSFRGYGSTNVESYNSLQFRLACRPGPESGLGGLSGGVTFDGQGRAVGIFNGFNVDKGRAGYINVTPFFLHETEDGNVLRPAPPVGSLAGDPAKCFACYPENTEIRDNEFLRRWRNERGTCVVAYDESAHRVTYHSFPADR